MASVIRQEVAQAILRDLSDPRLDGVMPSVNRVKVADDLATADVYMVLMGSPGKHAAAMAALQNASGLIRGRLGQALSTRTVPAVRFHVDEAYRRELEVLELIHQAEMERKQREAEAEAKDGRTEPPPSSPPSDEGEPKA